MAITRKLLSIRFDVADDGLVAKNMKVTFVEQPDADADNPGYEIPSVSGAIMVDPANLSAGQQTTITNMVAFVTSKLNTDRPLNLG